MVKRTTDKRLKNLHPERGKKFSKTNQPSKEQKSLGWQRKKALKELLNLCISGSDDTSKNARSSLAKIIGCKPADLKTMTFEEVIDLKQIQRAMKSGLDWERIKKTVYGQRHQIEADMRIQAPDLSHLSFEQLKELAKDEDKEDSTGGDSKA